MRLTLGFSTCPNDTYIFDAMVHRRIDTEGIGFDIIMADVEELNRKAFAAEIDITKISYHAYAYSAESYLLLNGGSALGFKNGPLLISKYKIYPDEINNLKIAVPGRYTTANLMLSIAFPNHISRKEYLFSDIEEVVLSGEMDAGLIIHENRFTYQKKGLIKVADLGEFWETKTGMAIPLGAIAINRKFTTAIQQKVDRIMKRSVEFALENPNASYPFVKRHSQTMDDAVMESHIKLYVNEFTRELGPEGRKAVETLYNEATSVNAIPKMRKDIFIDK